MRTSLTTRKKKQTSDPLPTRAAILNTVTEKAFQQQVIRAATLLGWLVYHTYDSRRSTPGYPDLTLCKPGKGFFFAELKTERGHLSHAQKQWIEALRSNGIECYIWRPRDWENIVKRFQQQ